MMTNLFSTFDPSSYFMNFSWMMFLLSFLFLMVPISKIENSYVKVMKKFMLEMKKEVSFTLKGGEQSAEIFLLLFFLFILITNFSAIYPQNFSCTSQIAVNLPLSLLAWFTIVMYGWIKNTNHMLSHLVPQGTPFFLTSFMVLIEVVSNLIRPITLCVRLTANLIAGHLLMTLLGNLICDMGIFQASIFFFVPMLLTILESGVALIQAYVFMTLITLYSTEIK